MRVLPELIQSYCLQAIKQRTFAFLAVWGGELASLVIPVLGVGAISYSSYLVAPEGEPVSSATSQYSCSVGIQCSILVGF